MRKSPLMNASHHETDKCPRCHGTGSGIYNAMSPESTCEVCEGSGRRRPAPKPDVHAPIDVMVKAKGGRS